MSGTSKLPTGVTIVNINKTSDIEIKDLDVNGTTDVKNNDNTITDGVLATPLTTLITVLSQTGTTDDLLTIDGPVLDLDMSRCIICKAASGETIKFSASGGNLALTNNEDYYLSGEKAISLM